ncbi:MAG: NADH-quinone oxidoreductase subunit L [Vulcanimicrobiota bacterium]
MQFDSMILTLILPVLGALLIGTMGSRWGRNSAAVVASGSIFLSFLVVLCNLWQAWPNPVARSVDLWKWASFTLDSGTHDIYFGIYVDALSLTLMAVITGVGFLIHWFSTEYMKGDPGYTRYFCYLNLFIAAMTLLVLANNFALLIVGWGGVGFASFALIGFWREKPSAAAAAKKAFVMNVIGDIGLMIAVFVLFQNLHTLDYATVLHDGLDTIRLDSSRGQWLPLVLLGLLVGAYAKSAQLPLHTWLPDAMEGPTPVSALIHAATMVTAGVYLLVRTHPLLELSPAFLQMVAVLGAITALYAAYCALYQTDLKRVLAYSTMSQLGYMFLAVGVGAYSAAIFHLVTHAFFKALLFLSAGIVIHAAHGEQDMRRLGGLYKDIPYTAWMFGIGGLALAGMFPFAGYFSKEAILHAAHGHIVLYLIGAVVALMTAFYTGRAFFMTFFGPQRVESPHLPGGPTVISCTILTILSVVAGFFAAPFARFLTPGPEAEGFEIHTDFTFEGIVITVLVAASILIAWALYGKGQPDKFGRNVTHNNFVRSGLQVDAAYLMWANGFRDLGRLCAKALDKVFTTLLPGLVGSSFWGMGKSLTETQTGQIRHYMVSMMLSVVVLLFYALLVGGGSLL